MKTKVLLFLSFFCGFIPHSYAVDDTAANLIPEGKISLSDLTDTLNRKYPKEKKNFWNVSGIAYHDFSGISGSDVIVGLSGYRDKGIVYNNNKQLVEDAGAGFGYFHLENGIWKLRQVELVEGKRYEGFEGADLTSSGKDQLVVYSAEGVTEIACVYTVQSNGNFKRIATIEGYGMGPRVSQESGKPLMVDFQRALINHCDDCQVYYGRPYRWDGSKFTEDKNDFLDRVQSYDPFHSTGAESSNDLKFFESYLASHPNDFCAIANCLDLSTRLNFSDKVEQYRNRLIQLGSDSVECHYCDDWLMGKNRVYQKQYLEKILNDLGK